ncbi:MAG: M56 family metallopeptidase [Gemmatimonadetes bacterium]|nr:M56 family metallopeptidase [Gemmatimonadota bacterium]
MTAAWMLWSIGAGLLFLVAGLALERLLDGRRRWVWMAAGAGTVILPAARLLAGALGSPATSPPPTAPVMLEPLAVTVAGDSALHSLDGVLQLGWAGLSGVLLITALIGASRLVRRRASWREGTLLGRSVLWSRDAGPAVVGLAGSRIVLPEWVRGAGRERQELVLAHEEEHQRARDAQLRFVAAALLVAFPWNPALWLQYHRLGLALELDCDSRVMRRWPDRRALYGDLLLRVGTARGILPGVAVAALAEQPSLLERRLRALLNKAPQVRLAQGAMLLFGAIMVVGLAVLIPGITGEGARMEPEAEMDISAEPVLTPYTVMPDYVNAAEIQRALQREYPPLLRDAGIGGTAIVWFFIDETGTVRNQVIQESSGHAALDEAALRVAPVFRFTPALNRDRAVPVWVQLPITFTTESEAESADAEAARRAAAERMAVVEEARRLVAERAAAAAEAGEAGGTEVDISAAPVFTPYTVKPDYVNGAEVMRALEREYPPLLRDAGIGGTTLVWFFIDETGVVQGQEVQTSSGHEALDQAALRVAPVFRFTPALNQDKPVPVWVQLPITFTTR